MATLSEDAARLRELRHHYDRAKADADAYKQELDAAEQRLFERMEHERVDSIRVDGTNFVRAATTYGQVQDRADFVRWAEEEMPELVEKKERKALINEIVRERIDTGEPLPPGLGFYVKQYVSQRVG